MNEKFEYPYFYLRREKKLCQQQKHMEYEKSWEP
jgi:hypothetical protein